MPYWRLLEKRGMGLHRRSSQMEVRNTQVDRMPSISEELTQVEAMERQWDSRFSIPELSSPLVQGHSHRRKKAEITEETMGARVWRTKSPKWPMRRHSRYKRS